MPWTVAESTLVATMGGQPQVVTFALDALLARGEVVREVIVLHLSADDDRLRRALAILHAEFAGDRYRGEPCRLQPLPVRADGRRVEDIRSEREADAVWRAVHELIAELKNINERPLHLCIAGGRRLLALVALSAAMVHFGHQDQVWHLYTPPAFLERARDGAILHARPEDGVRLVKVPFLPWGAQFPILRALAQGRVAAPTIEPGENERCQQVWDALSGREREVLRAFAEGLTPQEAAEKLVVTLSTLNTHKTRILAACRNAWGLTEDKRIDYRFVREHFERFCAE